MTRLLDQAILEPFTASSAVASLSTSTSTGLSTINSATASLSATVSSVEAVALPYLGEIRTFINQVDAPTNWIALSNSTLTNVDPTQYPALAEILPTAQVDFREWQNLDMSGAAIADGFVNAAPQGLLSRASPLDYVYYSNNATPWAVTVNMPTAGTFIDHIDLVQFGNVIENLAQADFEAVATASATVSTVTNGVATQVFSGALPLTAAASTIINVGAAIDSVVIELVGAAGAFNSRIGHVLFYQTAAEYTGAIETQAQAPVSNAPSGTFQAIYAI